MGYEIYGEIKDILYDRVQKCGDRTQVRKKDKVKHKKATVIKATYYENKKIITIIIIKIN
jgi:hypothetical protein